MKIWEWLKSVGNMFLRALEVIEDDVKDGDFWD